MYIDKTKQSSEQTELQRLQERTKAKSQTAGNVEKQKRTASGDAVFRVDLDFLVLRLDWGLRLHDPALTVNGGWVNPKNWFTRLERRFVIQRTGTCDGACS